jgi:hypothetical protein
LTAGETLAILVEESLPSATGTSVGAGVGTRLAFEKWNDDGHWMAKRSVLSPDTHGDVCTNTVWLRGIAWSPTKTALVYTAVVKTPKTASFLAQ